MKQLSTSDQLLLMAYGELSSASSARLCEQIQNEQSLASEWESLRQMSRELDTISLSPSSTSLRIIMDHSHKTEHLQEI